MKIVRPGDSIREIVDLKKRIPSVISFVGAGGKTTLIYRLSEELKAGGLKTIVTTTTKMYRPEKDYIEWTGTECAEILREYLDKTGSVTVGQRLPGSESGFKKADKIGGVPQEVYERLRELADVLLVEADGAKRKLVKVPAEHEPVIFPGTELVIGVLGMGSVGRSIKEAAHRPKDVAAFLNTDVGHLLTREDLEVIANSPYGLKKKVDCDFIAVGNQYEQDIL